MAKKERKVHGCLAVTKIWDQQWEWWQDQNSTTFWSSYMTCNDKLLSTATLSVLISSELPLKAKHFRRLHRGGFLLFKSASLFVLFYLFFFFRKTNRSFSCFSQSNYYCNFFPRPSVTLEMMISWFQASHGEKFRNTTCVFCYFYGSQLLSSCLKSCLFLLFFLSYLKRIKREGCHGTSRLARDPDFSPPHSVHFYSPLIHFDSSPRWVASHSRTIFGHFLLFTSPLLAHPVPRPLFWQCGCRFGWLGWQLTQGGGHWGRRPEAATCIDSHRRANTGGQHKHRETLGRWAKWPSDSVVSILLLK